MKDAIRRALRTLLQAFTGTLLAGWLASGANEVPEWSTAKHVVLSAAVAGAVAVVSFVHNALENGEVVPSVLKGP